MWLCGPALSFMDNIIDKKWYAGRCICSTEPSIVLTL